MIEFDWKGSRLKDFFKKKGLSTQQAAEQLGVSRQTVYQYFGSQQLTRDVVNKILTTFSAAESEIFEAKFTKNPKPFDNHAVSRENGDFLEKTDSQENESYNRFIDLKNGNVLMITPLVEPYAYGRFLTQFSNMNYLKDLPSHSIILDKFQNGNYLSFRVSGDGMDDGTKESIVSGSIVTAREIELTIIKSRFSFPKGKDFFIIHQEGVLFVRLLDLDIDKQEILCGNLNQNKEDFPDIKISIEDCKAFFQVSHVTVTRE